MFDDPTIELIQAAPTLEGLDAASLPRTLTQAYAEIVAVRMRVRELANEGRDLSELLVDIEEQLLLLQRLAFTQEAIAAVEAEGPRRRAAAFVAGTAHYVALQAKRLIEHDSEESSDLLSVQGIPAEVSATLLFLAAGASADAAELSKEIRSHQLQHRVEDRLLLDIKRLATGRLDEMLSIDPMPLLTGLMDDLQGADAGARVLYFMLLKCIHCIAAEVLGREGYEGALSALAEVEALCTEEISSFEDGRKVHSTYAGPRHLASLLRIVARELPADSLAQLPAPPTLNSAAWKNGLGSIARKRPYLWANHRDAVAKGYLTPGISSAISFPTGAGKSTLSELKILATLSRGKDVVFLAPTLALVDQTARALRRTFPDARLSRERVNDSPFDFVDETRLQPITVMTPERCLSMLGFSPELFREVGLVVFDECHLLHGGNGRRSVDAMLSILNLANVAHNADFLLLSAMMSNAEEISAWLEELTSRPSLPLNMAWKPTRQVRGSVVYSRAEVAGLKQKIAAAYKFRKKPSSGPTAALKRELEAYPQGLLALNFRWDSDRREDYTLARLSEQPMPLGINPATWGLTANANRVAAGLAALASSNRRTKSLIFAQTITSAYSAQKSAGALLDDSSPIPLTEEEQHFYSLALAEMGQSTALYVEVEDGSLKMPSLCHHGLLLPTERQLHESLFRRPDGVPVLVATSTLAQGMNLPSNVVIIAGDSKYDESTERLAKMHAHDLLNAAGRAGRAGESAYGLVLVVPSQIITVDDTSKEPSSNWNALQSIFSQSDQCLAIEDPFDEVLDQIQTSGTLSGGYADYLLRRLPIGSDADDIDAPARELLRKSLSGFRARKRGTESTFEGAIGVVINAREELLELDQGTDWADTMAATFGAPPWAFRKLKHRLEATPPLGRRVTDWFEWTANWIREVPSLLSELTRRDSLNGFMGSEFEKIEEHKERGEAALPVVLPALSEWIKGTTLYGMQLFREPLRLDLKQCDQARKFVLRLLPELAHIFSLPELVRRRLEMEALASVHLECLGHCVRNGFDTVEKLAMARLKAKKLSRVGIHKKWDEIAWWVPEAARTETWQEVYERVKTGIDNYENP